MLIIDYTDSKIIIVEVGELSKAKIKELPIQNLLPLKEDPPHSAVCFGPDQKILLFGSTNMFFVEQVFDQKEDSKI